MPHPHIESIRARYGYRCGYCGISEVDAGGELTVDHYRPTARGGGDDEDDLVYASIRCNLYKGDLVPDDDGTSAMHRVLHPLRDDPAPHLREDRHTGRLEPLTETGRFHIALLHLNRPALVRHRLYHQDAVLLMAKQRLLERENLQLRETLRAQRLYIARLRELLGLPDNSDW